MKLLFFLSKLDDRMKKLQKEKRSAYDNVIKVFLFYHMLHRQIPWNSQATEQKDSYAY